MSDQSDPKKIDTATIISELTGAVIGGRVSERRDDGTVVIMFAGMDRFGSPLSHQDILSIEAGTWSGEPLLRSQRAGG